MRIRKYLATALLLSSSLILSSCASAGNADSDQEAIADGPKASENRVIEDREITKNNNIISVSVDLGNTKVKEYTSPVRGIVVAPQKSEKPSPLIIVNHLRAPNCKDKEFAYPCKQGVEEFRFDKGMQYLGESLAKAGYTVLIPDLAPAWIGADLKKPYDQDKMWKQIITKFIENIKSDQKGKTKTFGEEKFLNVDFENIGLFLHSRSGTLVEPAVELLGDKTIKSVFAYGPAYDTLDEETFSPAPKDIPYLAVASADDADVGASANLWLTHYATQDRQNPALVANVNGLGHMYINRQLSEAEFDDRIGCDERQCPDALEHEKVIKTLSESWFNQTIKHEEGQFPTSLEQDFPDEINGIPLSWYGASNGKNIIRISGKEIKETKPGSAKYCRHPDPMFPKEIPNQCPEIKTGVVETSNEVAHLTEGVLNINEKGVKTLVLHLTPAGTPDNATDGTPITIIVKLENGKEISLPISGNNQALKSRNTDVDDGRYLLSSLRIYLPKEVTESVISEIKIIADTHPVQVSSIDLGK